MIEILEKACLTNQSVSLTEIAKRLGITKERVRQLYNRISREQPVPPLQTKEVTNRNNQRKSERARIIQEKAESSRQMNEQIKVLRLEGWSHKEVARRLDCSVGQVAHRVSKMIKAGEVAYLQPRMTNAELEVFQQQVKQLREEGLTDLAISQQLKASF